MKETEPEKLFIRNFLGKIKPVLVIVGCTLTSYQINSRIHKRYIPNDIVIFVQEANKIVIC